MEIGNYEIGILNSLLVFNPITFFLQYTQAEGTWIFIASGLAIILSAILVNFVALDGKSHWMEGVQRKIQLVHQRQATRRNQPTCLLTLLIGHVR